MTVSGQRVLLCDPDHFGTLAAVRDLGRLGLHVSVVQEHDRPTLAGASRYCRQRLVSPRPIETTAFLAWLLRHGADAPGTLLYPTSDEMAWFIAAHEDDLRRHFVLFQPELPVLLTLLDKARLYDLAGRLGIATPATFFPTSHEEVRALAHDLERRRGYPVIVKPRTQACMAIKLKGEIAGSAQELQAAVATLRRATIPASDLWSGAAPEMRWPLVQAYRPEAQQHTYSLAGFADTSTAIRAVRASSKVFQIPVRVGVGVAFEHRAVVPAQLAQLQALIRAAGYFGAFEVEFIHVADQDRYLLMDFNPRIYGQMQFEVARGLHLPRMMQAAALGDTAAVTTWAAAAAAHAPERRQAAGHPERYCDRWMFRMLLSAQQLSGRLTPREHTRWRHWITDPDVVDAVADADDPAPQATRRRSFVARFLRHPRASLRTMFR